MAARRCPICGAQNGACGPAGTGNPIVIDRRYDDMSGELNNYEVVLDNGLTTTLRLTDADAKKRGLSAGKASTSSKARAPQNKARSAANKQAQADALADE